MATFPVLKSKMPYDWMTQQQLLLQRIAHTSGRGQHQLQLQQKVLNRLLPVQGRDKDGRKTNKNRMSKAINPQMNECIWMLLPKLQNV